MDAPGPDKLILGAEESHGFLVGDYARDKDAAVAALLLAELAAQTKSAGQTLHEKLDALYWQYGYHVERTISKTMPGSEGMARMQQLMASFRTNPPTELAGLKLRQIRDFENAECLLPDGSRTPLAGPRGDVVMLDLEAEGNYVAVRPSGTEPKVKFYLFAYEPAEMLAHLEDTKQEFAARLDQLQNDLFRYADAV